MKGITNTKSIFGPDISGTRGKTSQQKPESYSEISMDFYKLDNFVTLAADVIFVNGTVLMIPPARKIKFVTGEHVPNCTVD